MSEKLFSAARQELLSHLLAHEGIAQAKEIRPLAERKDLPLSFAQERLWFLEQFKPGDPLYNCFQALLITGPLNTRALESSLNDIVRRHDILRTIFITSDGQPLQRVRPFAEMTLPVMDLSDLSDDERGPALQQLATAES